MEFIDVVTGVETTIIDGKSREDEAKSFIRIAKAHMIQWDKSLERGKQGKPCNFKDVSKKIESIRKDIINDEEGVLGNKHVLFIDTDRCLRFLNDDFSKIVDSTQQFMTKRFNSGLAREEALRKVQKSFTNYEDDFDSILADKKDYRLSFLLDEFDELLDFLEDTISCNKTSKGKNINRILDGFESILVSVGLQVDITPDMEEKKLLMRQYTLGKELTNKYLSIVKKTVGTIYGQIVTKVMTY